MTDKILDYLKSLAINHKDFRHGEEGKIAYYEFDWTGLMAQGRKRNDVILYVHKIMGRYTDNKGDYQSDTANVTFLILKKVPSTSLDKSRLELLACKKYGEQFIERMKVDQRESLDPDVCTVLKRLLISEITYEQTELTGDGWIGMQFRMPFRIDFDTEYDPDQWL